MNDNRAIRLASSLVMFSSMIAVATLANTTASAQKPDSWKLAVVFRRVGGNTQYVGTTSNPSLSENLACPVRPGLDVVHRKSPSERSADYEVWLARDAEICGIWYSSSARTAGQLLAGAEGIAARDDGTIERLIRNSRPAGPQPKRIVQNMAYAEWPLGKLPRLEWLCEPSTYIVVGRVAGNMREEHSPYNATYGNQHTVHLVAIEQYLKAPSADLPPILKVTCPGGTLIDWMDGVPGTKQGYELDEAPPLDLGERYIMFLKQHSGPTSQLRKQGYLTTTINGFTGKAGELDELIFVAHWQDKVLLRDGMTHAPRQRGDALDHWRFDAGPQIVDVPEAQAIAAIKAVVGASSK